MPKILSGPYGSHIHDILTDQGANQREREAITHPAAILDRPRTRDLVRRIALSYQKKGAQVLTTNTFSSRHVLKGEDKVLYPQVIRRHLEIPQEIAGKEDQIAVSFGPYGDCYKPEEGPKTITEGTEFWEAAFEPLLANSGRLDYALAETINNGTEVIAIAKAWKNIQKYTKERVKGVISLIPQKNGVHLLSGERIADVLVTLRKELGDFPVLLGLNCCAVGALEPTLRDVLEDREASRTGAQFRFLYPNASDLDPLALEQSPESKASRRPEQVAELLNDLVSKYQQSLPGAAAQVIINECCGGTPDRTEIISRRCAIPELLPSSQP